MITQEVDSVALNCNTCQGQCCRYFALQIDTPSTPHDYDNLRWYLAHRDVAVFIEGKDWYLQINNPCQHLTAEFTCGIYEQRPQICRDYGWDASGKTECHQSDKPCDHDHFFASREDLEAYLRERNLRWASMPRERKTRAKRE